MSNKRADKYASMEGSLQFSIAELFDKLRTLDAEKRALEDELDFLRAHVKRTTNAKPTGKPK